MRLPNMCFLTVGSLASAGIGMAIGFCLVLVAGFDLSTSPAWQLALYYLMLVLVLAAPSLVGLHPVFGWLGWFRWVLPGLALLLRSFSWGRAGFYPALLRGVRDDRYYSITIRSSLWVLMVIYPVWIARIFLLSVALSGFRMGWPKVMNCPLVTRVSPPEWRSVCVQGDCVSQQE